VANIFQDDTKSLPKKDSQIERIDFEQQALGGRKSHIPSNSKNKDLSIQHVPNASSKH
jgi:hypothetical protein